MTRGRDYLSSSCRADLRRWLAAACVVVFAVCFPVRLGGKIEAIL